MKLILFTLIGVFGLCLLFEPTNAIAESAQERSIGIEEIVVTSRRRTETAQSVPIPITAMTGEELRDRAANDLTDLSRITPNMDYQKSPPNRGTAQVFLRGIGQVNWAPPQDPKVGVYIDGVYLGRPQGAVFDIMDLDRIEVLRGPQGTLFGRNTTAGLVHIITNKPTDQFEADIALGAGDDGQLNGGFIVNIPVSETLAARFSFQHRESDGYVSNRESGTDWNDENAQNFRAGLLWTPTESFDALLTVDMQRVREHSGLGTCEWSGPDDGADVYQEFEDSIPAFFTGTGPLKVGLQTAAYGLGIYDEIKDACNATSPYSSGDNDPDDATLDAFGLNLTMNWNIEEFGTITSITSYREMDDLNSSWGLASDKVGTASYLEALGDGVGENPSDQFSQEFRVSGGNEKLEWVGGVYYFEEQSVNTMDVRIFRGYQRPTPAEWPFFYEIGGFGVPNGFLMESFGFVGGRIQELDAENESIAVFGEVTWHFLEDWSVTAGLRYTEDDRTFNRAQILSEVLDANGTAVFAPQIDTALRCPDPANDHTLAPGLDPMVHELEGVTGPMKCVVKAEFDKITPRVIFSYDATDTLMFYGGWSKGYSSGGFNQDVRARPYDPEISENWEFGMKSTWADNRVLLNLTGFLNDYKNQQIIVGRTVNNQPDAALINAQKAELYGIEGELKVVPAEGWLLMATFGWIDGEYDEFSILDESTNPLTGAAIFTERDLSDTVVARNADFTFSLSGSYTHYFDRGGDLTAQLGWAHRGRTFNTLETHDSSRQDAFGLMDGRLTWVLSNGKTSVSLWGRNLTDEEYYVTAIDLSSGLRPSDPQFIPGVGIAPGTNTKYWGEPRRVGLELRHTFN